MKVAICDDDMHQIEQLQSYFYRLEAELNMKFELFFYSNAEELLEDILDDVEILMLDIQMGELSGMDAARRLRDRGMNQFLIFITSNVEYALEGYEVHAYAFLRKPLLYSQVKRYISEIVEKLETKKEETIVVKSSDKTYRLNCEEIDYIEVYGHDVKIVMKNKTVNCSTPLAELESKLGKAGFFRCHKSYLVNMNRISYIGQKDVVLVGGENIPVSKYKKKDLTSAFLKYMGESL